MKSPPISSSLFLNNRSRLASLMTPGSMAVVGSGREKVRSGDQFYPFRPGSDFFYLTGIELQESVFMFVPGHPEPALREQLFIRRPTEKSELWRGHAPGPEQVRARSGIGQVRWLEELDAAMEGLIPDASVVYTGLENEPAPAGKNLPLSSLTGQLRMIKQPEEIEEIRKAVSITRSAFLRALKRVRPGMYEYQLEAELIGEFIERGAEGHAFEPIVASGRNALVLHYLNNNSLCREGELVLMDFGAEVNHYSADCSRTIPVSGRFTDRQRLLYDAVLRVFRKSRDLMVPGTLMADLQDAAGALWEEEHIGLGLYSRNEVRTRKGAEPLWKDYFMHGVSHSLGLDVHDPFDRQIPFEAGMVLTCEPALYLPGEGVGIRIENDILITEQGPVDLMEEIPVEADEIEELLNRTH